MSEKSFAVISVATAVVCGVFFYPPPPPERAQQQLSQGTIKPAVRSAQPVRVHANDLGERAWWRKKLAQLKPSNSLRP